mmetsp:Transcript_8037/g.24768  ORF Transcript_8037/g.24768 Transcript_8037/m.24768 type:complete len:450 (+) Transcript_8037:3456-4805(+)
MVAPSREATPAEAAELFLCDEAAYEGLLAEKVSRVRGAVGEAMGATYREAEVELEVHPSPKREFRQRANFRVVVEEGKVRYTMFSALAPAVPVRVERFPRGSARLNEMMAAARRRAEADEELRDRLFEARFQTTKSATGGAILLLCYNRPLVDAVWRPAAERLREALGGGAVVVVGRSRGVQVVVGADRAAILETLCVDGRRLVYEQVEGEFSQPNAHVCEMMLSWACRATRSDEDLLELYCGNGNFTCALAPNFRRVLATEVSKSNVACARGNVARNGLCDSVKVARLTAAEMGLALSPTGRDFNRLRQANVDLDQYDLSTLFVDPPRAGLDQPTLDLAATFPAILYVSCNPETLARDLSILRATHRLTKLAVFDQFAYSDHVESGVLLLRRDRPLDEPRRALADLAPPKQPSRHSKKRKPPPSPRQPKPKRAPPPPKRRRRPGCLLM